MVNVLEYDWLEKPMSEADFLAWATSPKGGACAEVKLLGDGRYAGIHRLMYHWTMIIGQVGDTMSYDDRYCYADQAGAAQALRAWNGTGDPEGWHRHPRTARRRPEGDPTREYVAP